MTASKVLCFSGICLLSLTWGCNTRQLTWQSEASAGRKLAPPKSVVVIAGATGGGVTAMVSSPPPLRDAMSAELMKRNYRVLSSGPADLRVEITAECEQKMKMRRTMVPIVHDTTTKWVSEVRQANVSFYSGEDKALLGMVSIRYDQPPSDGIAVVKDLLAGLDKICAGQAAGQAKLSGD